MQQNKNLTWKPEKKEALLVRLKSYFSVRNIYKYISSKKKLVKYLEVGTGYRPYIMPLLIEKLKIKNIECQFTAIDFDLDIDYLKKYNITSIQSDAVTALSTIAKDSQDFITFLSVFEHLDKDYRLQCASLAREILAPCTPLGGGGYPLLKCTFLARKMGIRKYSTAFYGYSWVL